MPKYKHAVTINGQRFTRNSESHQYTHCIAARRISDGVVCVNGWTTQPQKALAKVARMTWYYVNAKAIANETHDAVI
jgi:hypothetical protein